MNPKKTIELGTRVAVYDRGKRNVGTVKRIIGPFQWSIHVDLDEGGPCLEVHAFQLRKLKPRSPKINRALLYNAIWNALDNEGALKGSAAEHYADKICRAVGL